MLWPCEKYCKTYSGHVEPGGETDGGRGWNDDKGGRRQWRWSSQLWRIYFHDEHKIAENTYKSVG